MVCEHLAQCQGFPWLTGKESACQCRVQSLGQKDPLEEETEPHSSILAWEIPWTEEAGGPHSPWGCKSQARLK